MKKYQEGDKCEDPECDGVLGYSLIEDCSCHIAAPCHWCEERGFTCSECGEEY